MAREHEFTQKIKDVLKKMYGDDGIKIYDKSLLLQYINEKTRSANKGSKSRSSFANLYAIYVLVEDYLAHGYDKKGNYSEDYEGANFSNLFKRQRELPFGGKLQNHALNSRMNDEFKKYFPTCELIPILRDVEKQKYWINEKLLIIKIDSKEYNIAHAVIEIIHQYIETKRNAFEKFIKTCEELSKISDKDPETIKKFVLDLLAPNVDARLFEIVSYAILKYYYHDQVVYFGFDREKLTEENLKLYKTGRTNANDGGIDYVMRPLGRFFQVTETLDVKKYFLDIDKIERYPITFVIKSNDNPQNLRTSLYEGAKKLYTVKAIVDKYMSCIEEIINIPILKNRFDEAVDEGYLSGILEEIIKQSKVEFNYEEEELEDEE